MYTVTLKKGEEKRLLQFHPWVYANEVAKIEGKDVQGSVARVQAFDGRFVGYGFINHHSKILVRIVTRDETPVDRDFFYERIKKAKEYRETLGYGDAYRVVFGESDMLPALIVDKYGDHLSVQFLCLGMEVRKAMIVEILTELFHPACIFERSDVSVREKEGLPEAKGVLYGTLNENLVIVENGLKLAIDIENGQKTGYFLDQKENRENLCRYAKDKTVLDCFCNQGGFSLCAAKAGAKEVTAVDISPLALECVRKNAELNGFDTIRTQEADVFEFLKNLKEEEKKYDLIILDPPAFIKTADTVKNGYYGYRDINTQALKVLRDGGYLVTCSCSQHLTVPMFMQMLTEASVAARTPVRFVEFRTQARDHAPLLGAEEGLYLKVAVLQKIRRY